LDKPAKILIGGVVIGALTYGLGQWNTHRLEQKVLQLQRTCVAENQAEENKQGPWSALTGIFTTKATCDPGELAGSNDSTGIRGDLAAAERDRQGWVSRASWSALAIAVLSSVPWFWYFFLRRIRELREAIVGK
jgi:hypothetical protein